MAFRADVLPKVLAFVPADLQMTSSLRVASQDAKERVDTRWWTAQVQCVKAFVYRHVILFADDPEIEDEDVTVEEQQETFARNILLWIKPLLVNQPWRSEVNDEEVRDDATGEITPQAAYRNLRTALTDLSHSELFLDRSAFYRMLPAKARRAESIPYSRFVWGGAYGLTGILKRHSQ